MTNEPTVATTEKKPEVVAPPCNITVSRNEASIPFTNFRILKGKRADTFYPAIDVTKIDRALLEKWVGESNWINMVQTSLKKVFQLIAANCTNEAGVFDENLFSKYAADFTTTGMRLKEIRDKIDELTAELTKIINGGLWATDDQVKNQMLAMNKELMTYRQMEEYKKRTPKTEEDADEPSVPATN